MTKQCILQYVIIKPTLALIIILLDLAGAYHEGDFDFKYGFIYVTVISNFSVSLSMYFLILFYLAVQQELAPYRPIAKLASIKAILLFSFWQSVIIGIFSYFGVIPDQVGGWKKHQVATGLNDFIICIEMFLLSIVHGYVFPYQELQQSDEVPNHGIYDTLVAPVVHFTDVVNQADIVADLKHAYNPQKMKNAKIYEKEQRIKQEFYESTNLGKNDDGDDDDNLVTIDDEIFFKI